MHLDLVVEFYESIISIIFKLMQRYSYGHLIGIMKVYPYITYSWIRNKFIRGLTSQLSINA